MMMIFNTTYNNSDFDDKSEEVLGKKFNLLERIKKGGIGSGRLIIEKMTDKLDLAKLKFSEIIYGNIELRPKGIIIHYTVKSQRFSWLVPYYQLVVYNASFFSIHANGNFIQFKKNKNYKENKKFLDKMIDQKNIILDLEYYDY